MSGTRRLLAAFTTLLAGALVASAAQPQSSTSSTLPGGASSTMPGVDLLHAVPTTVIVNACDASPCDPAALVDNNLATAWGTRGSRSALAISAIVVRLPPNVRVSGVRVTVGAPGAAFEANPGAASLLVALGAQEVGDFHLDPRQRGPQWVPFNVQGGDLKLVFADWAYGTATDPIHFVSQLEVRGTTSSPSAASPRFEIGARASGDPAAIRRLSSTLQNSLARQPPYPEPCPCSSGVAYEHVADETACRDLQNTVHDFMLARAALARETCGSNPFAVDHWAEYDRRAAAYLHPVQASDDTRDDTVLRGESLVEMGNALARALYFCAGHPAILDTGDHYCV